MGKLTQNVNAEINLLRPHILDNSSYIDSILPNAALLPRKAADSDAKFSGRAGFWAGLVVFAGYCISAIGGIESPDFNVDRLPSISWFGLIVGIVFGFFFLLIVAELLPTRGIGVITLALSATSTIALFSYLFYSDIRDFVMYLTLGALFGILINIVFAPHIARGILSS